jgi:hypothetical protein
MSRSCWAQLVLLKPASVVRQRIVMLICLSLGFRNLGVVEDVGGGGWGHVIKMAFAHVYADDCDRG